MDRLWATYHSPATPRLPRRDVFTTNSDHVRLATVVNVSQSAAIFILRLHGPTFPHKVKSGQWTHALVHCPMKLPRLLHIDRYRFAFHYGVVMIQVPVIINGRNVGFNR